jgi:hypothetical protein
MVLVAEDKGVLSAEAILLIVERRSRDYRLPE